MTPNTYMELQEEKNVLLKHINETLSKIQNTLQNLNAKIGENAVDDTNHVDELKDRINQINAKIIGLNIEQNTSHRLTQTSGSKSIQIIEDQNQTSNN